MRNQVIAAVIEKNLCRAWTEFNLEGDDPSAARLAADLLQVVGIE